MSAAARLAAWLLLATSGASAEPSLWQIARDPDERARARARQRAEQLFDQAGARRADPEALRDLALGSAALLELSGGARRDPWQMVLLGRVLLEAEPRRAREAMQLVEQGLRRLPDSDFKRESWFDLGVGALQSGDNARALRAFTAALALAWDQDDRANVYRNRGKAQMLSGDLQAAVEDFRRAVKLARELKYVVLSHYGLGVALERSGDYPQGLQEVARAAAIRLPAPPYPSEDALDLPWLWTPEYDVHYFRALSAMAAAKDAPALDERLAAYEAALASWERYLPAAEARRDRFAANARRHRQRCLDELARLEGAASSGRVR